MYGEIASGGMATVHFGRLLGPVGFARTVAIKHLHAHFAKDADFAAMFLDEARLAARVQHPNVVSTVDVIAQNDELFLVMEYVDGESLGKLLRTLKERGEVVDPHIAVSILTGALHGLHAAHEAKSERGEPLGIVHRDVSPQNILVGRDGNARVLDFGVAKAAGRSHSTREGAIKGKVAYMSPEQIRSGPVDRRADVYAAGVVLWEVLTGQKLFRRDNDAATLEQALFADIPAPSTLAKNIPPELDAVILKALHRDANERFQTARDMALTLERTLHPALASTVGEWVHSVAAQAMDDRAGRVAEIESASDISAHLQAQVGTKPDEITQAADISGALAAVSGRHAPVDDASLVSASMSRRASRPSSRQRVIGVIAAAGVAVVVLVALGLYASLHKVSSETDKTTAAAATSTASQALTAASPPPQPSASAAPPVASAVASAPSANSTAATKPSAPEPTAAGKHVGVKPAGGTKEDCKVPYTVDSAGMTIYKRECL